MSKSLAIELAPDRIRVNAICPGPGDTPMLAMFVGGDSEAHRAPFLSSIPLGRLCSPEDVANAMVFLASDEASFITGAVLEVDGGRCIKLNCRLAELVETNQRLRELCVNLDGDTMHHYQNYIAGAGRRRR